MASSILGDLAGLGGGIFNFLNSDPNQTNTDAVNNVNAAAGNAGNSLQRGQGIIDAIIGGPSNPQFKQSLDTLNHYQQGQDIDAINNQVMANRQSLARGGPGLFVNQDRRDEATSSALAKAAENQSANNYGNVLKTYGDAGTLQNSNARGFSDVANDYNNLLKSTIPQQQQQTNAQSNDIASGIGGLGDLIGTAFSFF